MPLCAIACDNQAQPDTNTCTWHHNQATHWFANPDRPGSILWIRDWLNTNRGQHIRSAALDEHVNGSREAPTPLHLDTHDQLTNITDLVWSWERALRDEFNRPEPAEAFTLEAGIQFLRSWWPRLETTDGLQLVLADAWHEFHHLINACHTQAPWRQGVRHISGVPCPHCEQQTLAVFDGDERVTCTNCRALIHRDEYTRHVATITEQQQEAQTIAQMAQWIGIPAKTLHDWKRLGLIRPITDPDRKRDRLFRVADIVALAERRRAS